MKPHTCSLCTGVALRQVGTQLFCKAHYSEALNAAKAQGSAKQGNGWMVREQSA